ncbi:hypothetical protein M408DRAFT_332443 [Serendipita vermifera MAFF 305830]|uniref:Helicase ATP-binding domain-containing protein n=1 Tax=Serendipita vermifera MAFF 305830 TaxID=933852 RepID=A0A0C2W9Y4_SERVB|nr:hypothetical protein M408DRAFT_332443 [Serendipita vermifera MAFF 305830]
MVVETNRPNAPIELSDSDDSDAPVAPRPRQRIAKRAIVDSDSEDDEGEKPTRETQSSQPLNIPGAFPNPSASRTATQPDRGAPMTMPTPRPVPGSTSGFVGGFAPHLQGGQRPPSNNQVQPSMGSNYYPPIGTYKPPNQPPPAANRLSPNNFPPPSAPRPTAPGAPIKMPQDTSSRPAGSLLSSIKHIASNAVHGITHHHHHASGSGSGSGSLTASTSAAPPPPRRGDEFNIEQVHAGPGEALGEWDDLITNIHATAEDVANDYDEKDAIVPGFAEGVKLRPWQVQGRHWMLNREQENRRGGILADDMGLGKTIQMITLITLNPRKQVDRDKGFARGTLIIVGLNILAQWESEVKTFNPSLKVLAHHGASRTKSAYDLEKYHVVLTTYDVLASEFAAFQDPTGEMKAARAKAKETTPVDDDSDSDDGFGGSLKARKEALLKANAKPKKVKEKAAPLFEVQWLRVVVDEAQNIKNRTAKRSVAASALESKYRWALSMTSLQNNVEDLFSLLRFLRIKPLHDWDRFNEQIRKPMMAGRTATPMKRLHLILSTIMLRRLKTEIADLNLPERIVKIQECEFEEAEEFVYDQLRAVAEEKIDQMGEKNDMISALVLLLRLRQACDHPVLTKKANAEDLKEMTRSPAPASSRATPAPGDEEDELADLLHSMTVDARCETCHEILRASETTYCRRCAIANARTEHTASDPRYRSTKIRTMLKLLREIEDRPDTGKTIIFSEFVKMLDVVSGILDEERITYVRYDGSMKPDQRQASLDSIKKDRRVKVILISTKAGNSGLNLTCCSNVIMVDPWWNPAIEALLQRTKHSTEPIVSDRQGTCISTSLWSLTQ